MLTLHRILDWFRTPVYSRRGRNAMGEKGQAGGSHAPNTASAANHQIAVIGAEEFEAARQSAAVREFLTRAREQEALLEREGRIHY